MSQRTDTDAKMAQIRGRAAWISLTVGITLFLVKLGAWQLTGSTAVLSDALESIVNVVAAAFALFSVRLAQKPADHDHPYGHGKIEFLSAAFEGGLIFLAGLLIIYEGGTRLFAPAPLARLGEGLALTAAAGAVNLWLGLWLVRVGRRTRSIALEADGQHILSDVWTSALSLFALGAVWLSDRSWIDPLVALVAGANLLRVGAGLVREAADGMMDAAQPELLEQARALLRSLRDPNFVAFDHLRCRRQGSFLHFDLTIYVPDALSVGEAHALADRVEAQIAGALGEAQVICHIEPESLLREVPGAERPVSAPHAPLEGIAP